jgi:hypothetical protein
VHAACECYALGPQTRARTRPALGAAPARDCVRPGASALQARRLRTRVSQHIAQHCHALLCATHAPVLPSTTSKAARYLL